MSSDIGSYLGPPPTQSGVDPPDLFDRWVQLGTFQPILRLHSNNEDRLPWQYPQPVQSDTEAFLRLREALVPYTYTLAVRSHQTGMPMAEPLYLQNPVNRRPTRTQRSTSTDRHARRAGDGAGGVASTTVWFPPGRWVDFFTGATFTGPSSATLSYRSTACRSSCAEVGSCPSNRPAREPGHLTRSPRGLSGAPGSFDLYGDAGRAGLHQGSADIDPHHHVVRAGRRPPVSHGSRSVQPGKLSG